VITGQPSHEAVTAVLLFGGGGAAGRPEEASCDERNVKHIPQYFNFIYASTHNYF